jgi:hypothetical protein
VTTMLSDSIQQRRQRNACHASLKDGFALDVDNTPCPIRALSGCLGVEAKLWYVGFLHTTHTDTAKPKREI